jgi:hypothetical protein
VALAGPTGNLGQALGSMTERNKIGIGDYWGLLLVIEISCFVV